MANRLICSFACCFVAAIAPAINAQAPSELPFALTGCDDPKVPIGVLPSSGGTVAFRLSKDGKPDTTTLAVTKVLGMSVAGFKSAVARQLSACHFDVPKGAVSAATAVHADVTTNRAKVEIGPAAAGDGGTPLPVEPATITKDTMPFAADDRRVEERPRPLNCTQQVKAPTIIRATGSSAAAVQADVQQQAQIANEQYRAANGGTLTAMVRVGIDGKPGSQIRVIKITNPPALQNLGDRMGACRYVPGRILGVIVPTLMEMTVGDGSI